MILPNAVFCSASAPEQKTAFSTVHVFAQEKKNAGKAGEICGFFRLLQPAEPLQKYK